MIVVSGLLTNEYGEVLMALRKPEGFMPNLWELPGGKVEPGESERSALAREMREELGVTVRVGELVSVVRFDIHEPMMILLYHCEIIDGELQPLESQELKWGYVKEFMDYRPCMPSLFTWAPDIQRFIILQQGKRTIYA